MKKIIKEKELMYCLIITMVALIFIIFPIKSILIETYSQFLTWAQIRQGLAEIVIIYLVGVVIILGVKNQTVKCFLLIICSFLYLQNHQFLMPYMTALLYVEVITCIGTAARKLCKLKIENQYKDYLLSFTFGVVVWGAAAILFSLCGKGNFSWLRYITIGLFLISTLIFRRKPMCIYITECCKAKDNKKLFLIFFLYMIVLVQGAKSCAAFDYDSLWYGLQPENVLIGQNSFYDNLGMLAWVHYFPKFFELFAAPISDLGEYSFIHALNIWLYTLLVLTVYKFLKELKLSDMKALFYTIIVASIPTIANYSTTAKPDIFTGLFAVVSAMCFFKAIREEDIFYLSAAYVSIILSMCGKISAYPYIAILFCSGTLTYIAIYRKNLFHKIFQKENIPCLLIMGLSAIVLFGTFYRTYLLTGYPLYPFTVNLWKKIGFEGVYPFADYFGGRKSGFADGVVFNLQFYLKHIFNLLFTPNRIHEYRANHITISWYGNFGIFLSIVLVINALKKKLNHEKEKNIKCERSISAIILPVWVGMILISVFLFQYAQDGNYYIVPVSLGILYLAYLFENTVYEHKKLYYGIFTAFIITQFLIMFVSHSSWYLGTSKMSLKLFDSSFDSYEKNIQMMKESGIDAFEEYIVWQSYTDSRALGEGNEAVFFRLSTGYEEVTSVAGMTKGIFDDEENLFKYLDWANINFLILPKNNSDSQGYANDYQIFQNVFEHFLNLENVYRLETEDYILLDITSYTDSFNVRKVVQGSAEAKSYHVGEDIIFGSDIGNVNSSSYVVSGISTEEDTFCWTIGQK